MTGWSLHETWMDMISSFLIDLDLVVYRLQFYPFFFLRWFEQRLLIVKEMDNGHNQTILALLPLESIWLLPSKSKQCNLSSFLANHLQQKTIKYCNQLLIQLWFIMPHSCRWKSIIRQSHHFWATGYHGLPTFYPSHTFILHFKLGLSHSIEVLDGFSITMNQQTQWTTSQHWICHAPQAYATKVDKDSL